MEQIMSWNYHKMHLGVVNGLTWLSAELYLFFFVEEGLGSEGKFHIFLSLMQRFKAWTEPTSAIIRKKKGGLNTFENLLCL